MTEAWLKRERATATCVQVCFDEFVKRRQRRSPECLHAICKLTWLTWARGGGEADNTARVIAPALANLLGKPLSSRSRLKLQSELGLVGAPERVRAALWKRVGFTNFYNAYRSQSLHWMTQNHRRVLPLFERARRLRSDSAAREIYRAMGALPPITRRGGRMAAANLLTPVVACLDPRARSPVINGREDIRARLRRMGLSNRDLASKFDGLIRLLGREGYADALELDALGSDEPGIAKQPRLNPKEEARTSGYVSKPLRERDIREVRALLKIRSHRYTRLHDRMTNSLRTLLRDAELNCNEGKKRSCLFDARIMDYDDQGRDLLIEVKAAVDMPLCRMAVGQLLDYRRQLPSPTQTDLAALFPRRPPSDACRFMNEVGVKVIWFDKAMTMIHGDVPF